MAFKNVHEGTPGVLLLARLLGLQAGGFYAEEFKQIYSEPRRFGNAHGHISESFGFKVGLASKIKFWIKLEPSASGDFVDSFSGAASRYGHPSVIAYFGQNAFYADPADSKTNKHTGFSGVGALPPSFGFAMGTNFEVAP